MSDDPAPQLELQVGGAVPLDSGVYIIRRTDHELLRALQEGEYCNVLCPRQMGKTSTILRARAQLRSDGCRTALLDIAGRLGTPAHADEWYLGLLSQLGSQFQLGCDVKAWWVANAEPTANGKLLAFIREQVLARGADRFVVFLDEIDHTINLAYTDDFFLAIRSLYNDRAAEPDLRRIAFCLVGVFTPNELIKRQRTTTYNVGRTFELQDFDLDRDDLLPLAASLSPDPDRGQVLLREVLRWTGGQPYLTASACKKVAAAGADSPHAVDRVIEDSFLTQEKPLEDSDGTHFENIARFLGQRVSARLETIRLYRRLLRGAEERESPTPPVVALKLSGLVKTDRKAMLVVRNQIYRRRFDEKWAATIIPAGERWGRPAAFALAAVIVALASMNYFWFRPNAIATDLSNLSDDYSLAETKRADLRKILFWSEKADALWADYLCRRAERAESSEDRDAALLWRIKALQIRDRPIDRRAINSLILNDYVSLERTFRVAGPITKTVFNSGDESVITGSMDGAARVWNVHTGEPIGPILKHQDAVSAVAFSRDSRWVVTGSADKMARVWNAQTGELLGPPLKHPDAVTAAAISPDNRWVVTGFAGSTRVWNMVTGAPLGVPLKLEGNVAELGPFSDQVVAANNNIARVWNTYTGEPLSPPLKEEEFGNVTAAAFSSNGEWVVTSGPNHTLHVWNAHTGESIDSPLTLGSVDAVAVSPNGEWAATANATSDSHGWNVLIGPDRSPHGGTVRFLKSRTGKPIASPLLGVSGTAVALGSNGGLIVTGSLDGTARVLRLAAVQSIGQQLKTDAGPFSDDLDVAFSPNGERVVTRSSHWGKDNARLWDVGTGAPVAPPFGQVTAVAFSPNSLRIITGSWDHTARVWDARTGAPIGPLLNHDDSVVSVAFSPDGERVATAAYDSVRVWDARTGDPIGQPLKQKPREAVYGVAFSPDGKRLVTRSGDKTAGVWDALSGDPICPSFQHNDYVTSAIFSPNGESICTISEDKTARVWNTRTGKPITTPLEHEDSVDAVTFSPTGDWIVTCSGSTVRVWNARTGEPIGEPLKYRDPVTSAAFTRNGEHLLVTTIDWLHEFEIRGAGPFRAVRSRLVGRIPTGGLHISNSRGEQLTVLSAVGEARLRTIDSDFADTVPVSGDPSALLKDWERKLGFRIDPQGRLLTTTGDEWQEGVGIKRVPLSRQRSEQQPNP